MFDSLIKAIQESVEPIRMISSSGAEYWSKPVHLPPSEKMPDPIVGYTLEGLINFIDHEGMAEGYFIHVEDPTNVYLMGGLQGRNNQRACYYHVQSPIKQFTFGMYQPIEQFIVGLQALFVEGGDRSQILQILGNLKDEIVKVQADDGVTQTVNVRSGIARTSEAEILNPVYLNPLRTFIEVQLNQPPSPFILRIRKGGSGMEAALFEADGGQWKLSAIESIRGWLVDKTEVSIVA